MDFTVPADNKRDKIDNSWILGESWKSCSTWGWRWYQLLLVYLERFLKFWEIKLEELEIRGGIETTQTTALLRSDRILRRVLENCWYSNTSERLPANACVKKKKLARSEIIITMIIIIDMYLNLAGELEKNNGTWKLRWCQL